MAPTATISHPLSGLRLRPVAAARGPVLGRTRLSVVLLLVAVQGVVLVGVLLLLVLVRSGASVPTQTPSPVPQSAPVAPGPA